MKTGILMNTKEMILETALNLFNKNGSYTVTTRHIAAEMNISPGNLYYHYHNKEDIIRILFDRMCEDFNLFIRPVQGSTYNAGMLYNAISRTGNIMYKYRFFYMEISTLLEKDTVLKKRYMKIKHERTSDFRILFEHFEKSGMISAPVPDDEFLILIENAWALSEFMLQSMYLNRIKITPENIISRFSRVMYMVRPYFNEEFRKQTESGFTTCNM